MNGEGSAALADVGAFDGGATWMASPDEPMQRASHALAEGDDLWLVDPVDTDDLDGWLAERGTVAGVVVLLDRHIRDADEIARRHDVAVHLPEQLAVEGNKLAAPFETFTGELAGTGYHAVPILDRFFWHEVALYDEDGGTLVVPEAVGTTALFRTGGERLGVHAGLRLFPPRSALGGLTPDRVLVGHGEPVFDDAADALRDALANSRRGAPGLYAQSLRSALPV